MKRILLITTGGTISCGKGDNGLAPSLCGKELLNFIDAASDVEIEYSDLIFIDSTQIKPEHWEKIALEILSKSDIYDRFVITHGTDTLAYTAAMLSFLLCKTDKPVIITGSQRTMFEESSDAADNLSAAIKAACCDVCGVYILFGNKLIFGTRGYKYSTSSADGFISVNHDYAGEIKNSEVKFFSRSKAYKNKCKIEYNGEKLGAKIASVTILPGTDGELVRACADSNYDGIVLRSYGTGGIPNKEWAASIEYAVKSGVIIVMTSQCTQGIIKPDRYAVGNSLERLGIIGAFDMSFESAYCKLLWLLSIYNDKERIRRLFCKNICGEISAF